MGPFQGRFKIGISIVNSKPSLGLLFQRYVSSSCATYLGILEAAPTSVAVTVPSILHTASCNPPLNLPFCSSLTAGYPPGSLEGYQRGS